MKIHSYYSQSGTDLITRYIDSLTTDEQVDAYDVLNQLEENKAEKNDSKIIIGRAKELSKVIGKPII